MEAGSAPDRSLGEHPVTSLELFFDLVFVLAFTQVTGKLAKDATWHGLGRAILVLAVLWWAWTGYAWLTNAFDPEDKLLRLPVFGAMAALLVVALAVPNAFGKDAFVFAVAYLIVRAAHASLFLLAARGTPDVFAAVMRLMPTWVISPSLILIGSAFDGATQAAFWILAIVVDFSGPYLRGGEGWVINARHFAERFGLIVIIALGESIVSIGVGATGEPLVPKTILAAALGMALACCLWWAYFDVVAVVAAGKLSDAVGRAKVQMARDSYSIMHFPMVAGIILAALGVKITLAHESLHLNSIPAVALCGGIAIYLLALSLLKRRNIGSFNTQRLVTAAVLLAMIPIAERVSALTALTLVTVLMVCLIAYEATRYAEARMRIRSAGD